MSRAVNNQSDRVFDWIAYNAANNGSKTAQVDIASNRTYTYKDMNDPMEGVYGFDNNVPQESIDALEEHRKRIKFCSLSSLAEEPLMWAHYSKGARGVVIAVEVKEKVDCRPVHYDGPSHITAPLSPEIELSKRALGFDLERK